MLEPAAVLKPSPLASGSVLSGSPLVAAAAAAPAAAAADSKKRKLSNLELIREEEERKKSQKRAHTQDAAGQASRKNYWLHPGIVVKCMHKSLADGKYYKKKGVVEEVVDKYGARVRLLEHKAVLKLDQEYLETVIPKVGGLFVSWLAS